MTFCPSLLLFEAARYQWKRMPLPPLLSIGFDSLLLGSLGVAATGAAAMNVRVFA
jgi:hypothetical protein